MQSKYNSKQGGQVLIVGIFFSCIALLLTFVLFNTTQSEYAKQNATNIADTAVYSGLQFQARSLNYLAYTNRAMIANQVAVGQILSTSTWLGYVTNTSRSISQIAQMIPGIGHIIAAGAEVVATGSHSFMQTLPHLINISTGAIHALRQSQSLVYRSTSADTLSFIKHIIQSNDPRYTLSSLGLSWVINNNKQWLEFSQDFTSEQAIDRQATTIAGSFDRWINNRSQLRSLPLFASFSKAGTTRLVKVSHHKKKPTWIWEGRDASSFWTKKIKISKFRLKWVKKEIPIPTGQSHSTSDHKLNGHWLAQVPRSERIAKKNKLTLTSTYDGLQGYWDLQALEKAPEDASISLALEVILKKSELRTTNTIDGIGAHTSDSDSIFQLQSSKTKNIASVSTGKLSFSRPYARQDKQIEYSNLFNPFWSVRLVPADKEKKKAWLSRALVRPF